MSNDAKKPGAPERRLYPKGTTIFKEGEAADCAYILDSGAVQIFKMVGGRRIQLGVIAQRGIFGELGVLDDGPRMAAAYAAEDSVCVIITRESIAQMLDEAPGGLRVLVRSLVQTIRTAGDDLAEAKFLLHEQSKEAI
jgi:CRP-like cAMP-binding protein